MSYRDDDDPFEEDIVFDQAGLLSTSRKSGKSTIRRVSSGKCAMFSKTLGLCGAFLGLGLTSAIPGPLSPVPPSILSHDIYLMTYEVMCRCQGFMIGAMFGARLLDRFNRLFLVFLALLVTALLVSIIPWCGIVWLLRTDMFLLGVSFGFLTTGGNVLCLDLWGRNSGPFMQALHFSFSLGVFLAPFLSQPLMTPVNNPLPLSSPAPAMFPLSRLPRDTRNMSSISTGVMLTNTTFAPPEYHPVAGKLSVALLPPTSASSTVEDLGRILKHQPVSKQNASNSGSDSTPSLLANSTTQRLTAGTPLSNVTTQFLNLSAATTVFPAVASPSPLNKSDTREVGNVSTTTHRTPRPKPVLTNSEKLQDKKWEHEKFRKPPPEDLVPVSPVSTTMKPILRPPNTFAFRNISNVSILSDTISGNNSTTHNINSVKSNTGIPGPQYSLVSLKPVPASSSISKNVVLNSTFISNNSSSLSSRITLDTSTVSAMPLKKPPQIVSEAGITLPNTAKVGISSNSSDAFSLKPTSSTPKTTFSVQDTGKTNNSFNPDLTLKAVTMTPAHQYGRLVSTNSSAGALMGTVGRSNSKKPENMDHIKLSQPSVGKPSFDHKEEKKQKLSARPPHPEFKNMKSSSESHSMEKSISLEEQGLAAVNPPLTVPTVAENEPSLKAPEKLSPLGKGLTAQLTTTKPNIISSHIEDLSQRPFGVSHVKAQGKDNPMGLLVNGHKTADENKTSAEITIKNSSKINATNSGPSSMLKNNASGVSESSSGSDPSASPKHTHHSKPASTVVNDTEVTHTVMDTFANCLEKYGLSRMELVYLTVGMVLLATSLLFLGFLCFNPRDPKSKTDNEEINNHRTRGSNRNRMNSPTQAAVIPSRCLRHALIALMMLLMMITSGVQAMYGQLLLVYAIQSPLQMPQSTGSALTATYWGALTSTRFACILLASALSPTAMLILSLSFCSCATWLLSAFSSSSEAALWIGSVMVSVGTASVFPSGMLWMQRHVSITHRVAAMLVMGPAMGEMFFPSLAYKMMVSLGSASLVHLPALLSLFAIALWAAVWRLARYHRPPLCSHGESSGYHLANQHDEDDLLDLTMSPIVKSNGNFSRNSIHSSGISHRVPQMST